jgi:two-component system sensor histidine kinase BaeS
VAQGWLIASSVAVGLAAVVGWLISRRITQPVLQLTTVTQRMAAGDLSRRADVQRRDELGTLAHSFNEMADQVEVTITTLRRFVSDAAHEIHSPLTALQTDLELSVTEQDETRRHELIDRAQQQTIRLRELADNLLDLSRVEAAGVHAPRVPVNLNDLLRDLSEPYASQAEQAGLTLSFDVPQDPIELRSDPAQLRRAIGNLIDNAIKFTPEGGAVTIELRKTAGTIELCVQDTGIGIPEDDLPQLFSRFHRGRNATTYPGNGLGLAIVKAIVEAHGGQVSAANTSPGARFCITLPEAR